MWKRHSGVIQNAAAYVATCAMLFMLAACGQTAPPTAGSVMPAATPAESLTPLPSTLPLDAESRQLVALLDPAEVAQVVVVTTWTDELSGAAAAAGMHVAIDDPNGSIEIAGPIASVLDLLDGVPVTRVTVQEPTGAMRRIPANRPSVEIAEPGHPYLAAGFPGDLMNVDVPSPQREAMLRTLAELIQTIDGRPYERLTLEGNCGTDKQGPSCGLIAAGFTSGSLGREDEWSIRVRAGTEPGGAVESVWTTSVPRPVLRAAEWLARHDDEALQRIAGFTTCCGVSWNPARPGWITLLYSRLCAATLVTPQELADTGVCEDELSIEVDVRSGVIVSIEGPAH
jgi:hypothetical protein